MFFRTDMAVERRDLYRNANKIEDEIQGIKCEEEKIDDITITRVEITNEEGQKALDKRIGNYITIDVKKIKNISEEKEDAIINVVSQELKNLIDKHIKKDEDVLIVGLGNLYATPDSLGSKVVEDIEITRHIKLYLPNAIDKNIRSVSAFTPGVLGITGIETLEIVKGVVDNVKPKLVIAIDSLCSKNISRISKSIQICDTGIVPGGGVGNRREELSEKTLNVPVIGLGIPTVVDLETIMVEGLEHFVSGLQEEAKSTEYLNKLKENNFDGARESLNIGDGNMIVTPKEIDELIENMKEIVARGINEAVN